MPALDLTDGDGLQSDSVCVSYFLFHFKFGDSNQALDFLFLMRYMKVTEGLKAFEMITELCFSKHS